MLSRNVAEDRIERLVQDLQPGGFGIARFVRRELRAPEAPSLATISLP